MLAQANRNLDSYLRRMMRIADTVYYRVIKNTDLAEGSYTDAMGLLYEENRDDLVSLAVFDSEGNLVSAVPLASLKAKADPAGSEWFLAARKNMENLHFSSPHVQNIFDDPDSPYRWVVCHGSQRPPYCFPPAAPHKLTVAGDGKSAPRFRQ